MFTMKLDQKYYNYILNGTKEYEIRLNDEKRRLLKKGDFIKFQNVSNESDYFIAQVDDLLYFNNFLEVINSIDIKKLSDKNDTALKLMNALNHFYSKESQEKYGVVAIKLNKNIIIKQNLSDINYDDEIFNYLKKNYSDFKEWFKKLVLNDEICYITKHNGQITSILIIKMDEKDSKQVHLDGKIMKIRTLLVSLKNKGIGTRYIKLVNELAKQNEVNHIYITCKKNNLEMINFLNKRNFKYYDDYFDEKVFYQEVMSTILMSIKPEYVEKLFNGTKKYEYRKKRCKKNIDKIIVYSTNPVKKVVGELEIEDILEDNKEVIWEETKLYSGIVKEKYDSYFKKEDTAVAYKIKSYKLYDNKKELSDFNIKASPQSYVYIK